VWVKSFREPGRLSPPEADAISSRCVRLEPGSRVGEHVTAGKEELLFVLEGEATLRIDGTTTRVPAGHVAYVPPETRHDVVNEGGSPVLYVYATAKRSAKP